MIIKKIPTSKLAPIKSKALNIRALTDYIAGPTAGRGDEKLEHTGAVNLLNVDHAGQVDEMVDLAEMAKRSPQPVQHWIISWREGEQPTADQAKRAVELFMAEMKLEDHQAIYAVHRDTDNWHLHLAVNRVHPETERVVAVNNGFDHEVAQRAIARIEHEQGWQREHGARYRMIGGAEVERTQSPVKPTRQPTTRVRDVENRTGEKSCQRIAIQEAAPAMRRANDWASLHAELAKKGMRFETKGSGAILWVGETPVKASQAGRDCSLSALERRLGEFQPSDGLDFPPPPPRGPEPLVNGTAGWGAYAKARAEHQGQKRQRTEELREEQRQRFVAMREKHQADRQRIFQRRWKGAGAELNALRSLTAAQQAGEKAALREQHQQERAELRRRYPRLPDFEQWLRQRQLPELADRWRHRERQPWRVTSQDTAANTPVAPPQDIRAFRGVQVGVRVVYLRGGQVPAPSFSDEGRRIQVHEHTREAVLAALQLSEQKWGGFLVNGDQEFRRLAVSVAAEHSLKLVNPELQEALKSERERFQRLRQQTAQENEIARETLRRDPVLRGKMSARARRPPSPQERAAGAYEAHFAELRKGLGPVDLSRVDRDVALRMRITGFAQADVEHAIQEAAARTRAGEGRDWKEYARRATAAAFGVAGERDMAFLKPMRSAYERIEGRHLERYQAQERERDRGHGR